MATPVPARYQPDHPPRGDAGKSRQISRFYAIHSLYERSVKATRVNESTIVQRVQRTDCGDTGVGGEERDGKRCSCRGTERFGLVKT